MVAVAFRWDEDEEEDVRFFVAEAAEASAAIFFLRFFFSVMLSCLLLRAQSQILFMISSESKLWPEDFLLMLKYQLRLLMEFLEQFFSFMRLLLP